MLLSICIPTYNRCKFLKKNLDLLAQQIRECDALNDVEINVSDNGSPDETDIIVKNFIANNKDIKVGYTHLAQNLGPDKNYIYAMHMAHGDYTILLGDDDYLIEDGLSLVLNLIRKYPEIDVFLSNRIEIDEQGNILRKQSFLCDSIKSREFDFRDDNQAGFFFSLCKSVGGCLTFISSIIYKTSIINDCGKYDGSLDGTYYSFWFYLWGKLSRGGKLFYYDKSYILNTQTINLNFGNGLKRTLVEFEGFQKLADIYFKEKSYYYSFLEIPKRCKPMFMLAQECIVDNAAYKTRLIPILESYSENNEYISDLYYLTSKYYHISCLVNMILPRWLMHFIHSVRNKK